MKQNVRENPCRIIIIGVELGWNWGGKMRDFRLCTPKTVAE